MRLGPTVVNMISASKVGNEHVEQANYYFMVLWITQYLSPGALPMQAMAKTPGFSVERITETTRARVNHNMGLTSSETVKGASVLDFTSSTVTPSASSIRVRPLVKSTSKTHCASC